MHQNRYTQQGPAHLLMQKDALLREVGSNSGRSLEQNMFSGSRSALSLNRLSESYLHIEFPLMPPM